MAYIVRRCVGIGRRDGLKIRCQRWRVGSSPTTGTIMNEPRFSNCFIEKRGSSYVESLVVRDFPLFVAPDLFFKILQMQKQYFYIGLKFRQYFSIKQACKHLQMPVVSYNSAFGEAALHYRTEYTPLRFCGNVVQRYSPSGRLPLS